MVLPLAILYMLGGLIYTLGGSGDVDKKLFVIPAQNIDDFHAIVLATRTVLSGESIELPSFEPLIKNQNKKKIKISWNRLSRSIIFEQKYLAKEARVTVRDRSSLTKLMRIHRGEAGLLFKIASTILVIGMLMTMLIGVLIALSIESYRKILVNAVIIGVIAPLFLFVIAY